MGRKRVFQLLLTGRITAVEAERLIAVKQAGRDGALIVVACIAIGLLVVVHLGLAPVVQSLVHTLTASERVHGAAAMVMHLGTSLRG